MKTVMLSIVSILAAVIVPQKGAYAEVESVPWSVLKDADGNVAGFEGKAWFCQAKTFTGNTECYFGARPTKSGCYVLLNRERTAWIAVDDAAAQLAADFRSPGDGKRISSASGFGCGVPDSNAWWLLWEIK